MTILLETDYPSDLRAENVPCDRCGITIHKPRPRRYSPGGFRVCKDCAPYRKDFEKRD